MQQFRHKRSYISKSNYDYYERHCKNKIKHTSVVAALNHIESLRKKDPRLEHDWYECNFCSLSDKKMYHVGGRKEVIAMTIGKMECTCSICGALKKEADNVRFHIDRDIVTAQVKGILCDSCFGGITMLKRNPILMTKAIVYIQQRIKPYVKETEARGKGLEHEDFGFHEPEEEIGMTATTSK
jgi:hypothetical protein